MRASVRWPRNSGSAPRHSASYEARGVLPAPNRGKNRYREFEPHDVVRLRVLVGLRRLDVPLDEAAELAALCVAGECTRVAGELRTLIATRRTEIAQRTAELAEIDADLAKLDRSPLDLGQLAADVVGSSAQPPSGLGRSRAGG